MIGRQTRRVRKTLFASTLAQQVVAGTVVRVGQPARVIVLDEVPDVPDDPTERGSRERQPMAIATVVRNGRWRCYRHGRYVAMRARRSPYEGSGVVGFVATPTEPGRAALTLEGGRHVWIYGKTRCWGTASRDAEDAEAREIRGHVLDQAAGLHGDQSGTVVARDTVVVTSRRPCRSRCTAPRARR